MPALTFALLAVAAFGAVAHEADGGDGWRMSAWGAALLVSTAVGYAVGATRLWRSAGAGRGVTHGHATAFAAGWLAALVALLPPLDTWGQRLFSVHMVQHEVMMVVAAPLLVLGTPLVAWSWAWPAAARTVRRGFAHPLPGALWGWLTAPLGAWLVHAAVLWSWHVPRFFESALGNEAVHELQHVSFMAAALLFWWSVLNPRVVRGRPGAALLSLFTTMLHTGLLGALLALTGRSWYPAYGPPALAAGIDPVADQQLGGLLMWLPGAVAYLVAALYVAARLLGRERVASIREARS